MSDLISRQSVINAVANTCFWLSADNWEELTKCINSIPSVENKGKDRPKELTLSEVETYANEHNHVLWTDEMSEKALALIKADRGRPKGEWKRMSDLPEDKDDRYECSRCGNVVHYKKRMDLYTFNSWCGRCGSNNNPNRYDER